MPKFPNDVAFKSTGGVVIHRLGDKRFIGKIQITKSKKNMQEVFIQRVRTAI